MITKNELAYRAMSSIGIILSDINADNLPIKTSAALICSLKKNGSWNNSNYSYKMPKSRDLLECPLNKSFYRKNKS